jgi:hypothetical protein
MKKEIKVGQQVIGNILTMSNGERKHIEYEGIVCGKGNHRKTDLLIKVQGIIKPFWVMSSNVIVK